MPVSKKEVLLLKQRMLVAKTCIVGDLVELRLVQLSDCTEEYVSWLNDPDVNRFLETRWHLQDIESVMEFVIQQMGSTDSLLFAIMDRKMARHIGNLKIGPINFYHSFADISYFIGNQQYWRKGYASEAVQLIKHFCWKDLKLRRLQAGLYQGNEASKRLLQNCGFLPEAVMKNKLFILEEDRYVDHVWLSIFNPDIQESKEYDNAE